MMHFPLLTTLIALPMVGGVLVWLTGAAKPVWARWLALGVALIELGLCVPLVRQFKPQLGDMQFVERLPWLPQIGAQYHLGVDGLAMPLVVLTALTTVVVILAAWRAIQDKVAQYLATFLVMQGMVVGIFCALDAILFYLFWEGVLIPMYLCIGVWGGQRRSAAAIKFFLYTFLGSTLMLLALLYLGLQAKSFAILSFYPLALSKPVQLFIFAAFFLAFAIKVPMWPVHTWLPDAHTEAPTGGSVILAALMLKVGGYGFLRFSLPIVPDACQALSGVMLVLSLVAIVYIGLVALSQTDMKRLIAYSSVAHMGFVTLGTFLLYWLGRGPQSSTWAVFGIEGAMVQMIAHAFGSGALFAGFGMLYDRMHTRQISDYAGVAQRMPVFAAFFLLFCMANVGLPGTAGFVGEFMVIMAAFNAHMGLAALAGLSLITAAGYTLWMYKRVFFGKVSSNAVAGLTDIGTLDRAILLLLAVGVFWLGLYPKPLVTTMHASVQHLVALGLQSKLG